MSMQVSIQTDKKKKQQRPPSEQEEEEQYDQYDQGQQKEKERRIKKLTQVNRQLIEKLKQQNDELTKKINKQKLKPGRSLSVKSSPKSSKQIESTKRELMNAYKQIDMYKSVLTNLKAKEISIDSVDKINQLQNKVKYQEGVIDQLQKEIKYLSTIKQQQQKQLKVFQNDDVKNSVLELEKQVVNLKEKIKMLKKNAQKRDQIEKKQHAYQIELERALRKLNDQYYPGKEEKKQNESNDQYEREITEKQWQVAKAQLNQLRKSHQQNGKKIDHLHRQKNKELKSAEQNQLKIKEKSRKLQTLKNKLSELTKLVTVRQSTKVNKGLGEEGSDTPIGQIKEKSEHQMANHKKAEEKKDDGARQVKKWIIPQGYCLEKGKIMPDSIFFSDKAILKDCKKSKITKVYIWHDSEEWPCIIQLIYANEKIQTIEGIQPIPNGTNSLQLATLSLKEGDYIHKIQGSFIKGELAGIQFYSKFGRQLRVQSQNANSEGQKFSFEPRPSQIPSCMFGAYVKKSSDDIRVCHLGFEFMTDW